MKTLKLSVILFILFLPSFAFAWGPLTHIYLGSEIYSLGALLPAGIYALLKKYRHDFLYGNLMADLVIGRKFLPGDKNPHSWDMALNLLGAAGTQQEKAFVYGYMSHLATDTVAHGTYTKKQKNIRHAILEMKADSLIDRKYWVQAMRIERETQRRNDVFLEVSMQKFISIAHPLSFKTNKKIFKSMLFLSCFNQEKVGNFIQKNAVRRPLPSKIDIQRLHTESIDRIVDILCNGKNSKVINENPMSESHKPVTASRR